MLKLEQGRPADTAGRLEKEIRVYDFLDKLGVIYDRVDHSLKGWTMSVCAGVAVIDEFDRFIAVKLTMSMNIPIQKCALVGDALALGFEFQVIVGIRQADVQVQFLHRASPPFIS